MRNQLRALADKEKAIETITEKLALSIHSRDARKALIATEADRAKAENRRPRRLGFGYKSAHEHAMKRRRLSQLEHEATDLRAGLAAGVLHITRGGKRLMRNRLHLDEAGITEDEWRARWRAKRWGFGANGEAGKRCGNETIRISPDGVLEVDLPPVLAHLSNVTARGVTRYRFAARVRSPTARSSGALSCRPGGRSPTTWLSPRAAGSTWTRASPQLRAPLSPHSWTCWPGRTSGSWPST
ncbi:MAG: hypothetical protein ACYCST_10660 [Acidimicrobiales bacterium]